jgi:hypothetical protein
MLAINKIIYNNKIYTFGNPEALSYIILPPPIQFTNNQLLNIQPTH